MSGYQPKTSEGVPADTPSVGSGGTKDEIRYLGEVQKLSIGPGDILVLSVPDVVSTAMAERLKASFSEAIGLPNKVVVLCNDIKVGVITSERTIQ